MSMPIHIWGGGREERLARHVNAYTYLGRGEEERLARHVNAYTYLGRGEGGEVG